MRRTILLLLAAAPVLAAAVALDGGVPGEPASASLEYAVVSVRGRLLEAFGDGERRLTVGDTAAAGAVLRTGWFSSAELEELRQAARFVLSSRTRVRLAEGTPGMLLELERGGLRALFGRFEGETPARLVTTPSAVLAVRGTEYGVAVDSRGRTEVTVFAGTVEVADREHRKQPLALEAGQFCSVEADGTISAPRAHRLSAADWDRGRRPESPGMGAGVGEGPGAMGQPPGGQPGGSAPGAGSGGKRRGPG